MGLQQDAAQNPGGQLGQEKGRQAQGHASFLVPLLRHTCGAILELGAPDALSSRQQCNEHMDDDQIVVESAEKKTLAPDV